MIAFEPFISTGAEEVYQKNDGWTYATEDKSFVAQIEHTIIVTKEWTADYYRVIALKFLIGRSHQELFLLGAKNN